MRSPPVKRMTILQLGDNERYEIARQEKRKEVQFWGKREFDRSEKTNEAKPEASGRKPGMSHDMI